LENQSLKSAIIETLSFFYLYNYPLTLFEIRKYTNFPKISKKKLLLTLEEADEITTLIDQETEKKYYALKNTNCTIESRQQKSKIKNKLLKKTNKYIKLLRFIPFVRMVAVCNNAALGVPDKKSDIDLFIVAAENRLFTCRLLITFLLQILGVRRHGKRIKHRFCLSFFVTEDCLDLSLIALSPKDTYLAYWIRSLLPIIDQNIYTKLLEENKNFLSYYFQTEHKNLQYIIPQKKFSKFIQRSAEFILNSSIGNYLENKLKTWQLSRSKAKKENLEDASGIVISEKMLKFHNVDRRKEINAKLQELVNISF